MSAPTRTALPNLPLPLRAFLATALTLSALCWGTALLAHLLGWGPPFNWPLFPRGSHFYDFVVYLDALALLRHPPPPTGPPGITFAYFAPGVFLYSLFTPFGRVGGFFVYLGLVAAALATGIALFLRALHRRGLAPSTAGLFVLAAALTSFPLFFCLERGNIEVLLAAGVAAGVWAFCTGRPTLAACLWGLFGSVKLYPILLVALFLSRRQIRSLLLTLAVTVLTNLAALLFIGPTLAAAWHSSRRGTALFVGSHTTTVVREGWDHALFALLKLPLRDRLGLPFAQSLALYLPTLAALMLLLYAVRIRRQPLLNQLVLLSVCTVLLPPTSYPYTLTQLYAAWAAVVLATLAPGAAPFRRAHTVVLVLFALVFCPFNLVGSHGVGFEGTENGLLLLALFLTTLLLPLSPSDTSPAHPAHPRRLAA